MKSKADVLKVFTSAGWQAERIDHDRGVAIVVGAVSFSVYPYIRKSDSGIKEVAYGGCASLREFDLARAYIGSRDLHVEPLVVGPGISAELPVALEPEQVSDAEQRLRACVAGLEAEVRAVIDEKCKPEIAGRTGSAPLLHLSGLSVQANVKRIKKHIRLMDSGRNPFICTYVTRDYLARSLELAEHKRAGGSILDYESKVEVS